LKGNSLLSSSALERQPFALWTSSVYFINII